MLLDRRVADPVLELFSEGGALRALVEFVLEDPALRDFQLRGAPGSAAKGRGEVGVYVGMSRVLKIEFRPSGFKCDTDKVYRPLIPNSLSIGQWTEFDQLGDGAVAMMAFVAEVAPRVGQRHTRREGRVHAAISHSAEATYVPVNREVSFHSDSEAVRHAWFADLYGQRAVLDASPSMRSGLDFLAVGSDGRLLAIEAKACDGEIAEGAVQSWVYANLIAYWVRSAENAVETVVAMGDQRVRLGLGRPVPCISDPVTVVPVLAIGAGKVSQRAVANAVSAARELSNPPSAGVAPWEIWLLDEGGLIIERILA